MITYKKILLMGVASVSLLGIINLGILNEVKADDTHKVEVIQTFQDFPAGVTYEAKVKNSAYNQNILSVHYTERSKSITKKEIEKEIEKYLSMLMDKINELQKQDNINPSKKTKEKLRKIEKMVIKLSNMWRGEI